VLGRCRIDVDPSPIEKTVIAEKKNIDRRAGYSRTMNIVRDALETEGDSAVARRQIWFKAELCQLDDTMTRDDNSHSNAELFERERKGAHDVAEPANFGKRHAFSGNHQDMKVRHATLEALISPVDEFLCAKRCANHGLDQSYPQTALFQF